MKEFDEGLQKTSNIKTISANDAATAFGVKLKSAQNQQNQVPPQQ
jgi:hypothetical protein